MRIRNEVAFSHVKQGEQGDLQQVALIIKQSVG